MCVFTQNIHAIFFLFYRYKQYYSAYNIITLISSKYEHPFTGIVFVAAGSNAIPKRRWHFSCSWAVADGHVALAAKRRADNCGDDRICHLSRLTLPRYSPWMRVPLALRATALVNERILISQVPHDRISKSRRATSIPPRERTESPRLQFKPVYVGIPSLWSRAPRIVRVDSESRLLRRFSPPRLFPF